MPVYTNYSGEIAAQLDVYRKKGQKEAAANRPPSDSLRMDQHEAALHTDAEKWLANEQRLFDGVLTESARAVTDTQQKTVELNNRADQLLSDSSMLMTIEADMSEDRGKLVAATESRMRAEVDWRYFRAKNHISTQADYPESRILHLAIIAVLALVETCINAFFYENAQGLLGGFFVALSVAAVNMIGAVILGYGFRYKNLTATDSKILGWGCLLLFIVLAVYCNALFAAFRSEYQLLVDPTDIMQVREGFANAASEAKKIFILDMHIADLSSFVLLGLGIVLSGLAFHKGYTLDDKYPGYGKIDRIVKQAQSVEIEQQDLLRQKIKDFLHHRRADVQAVLHEPAQLIGLMARRISDLSAAQSLLSNQAATIQRDFAMLVGAYRNANTAVRATEPPSYFKEIADLTPMVDNSAAKQYIEELERVQERIKLFREKYQEPLNGKLHSLQSESASILNQTFSAFLKDVEDDAHERINRAVTVIHRRSMEKTGA